MEKKMQEDACSKENLHSKTNKYPQHKKEPEVLLQQLQTLYNEKMHRRNGSREDKEYIKNLIKGITIFLLIESW